MDSIDHTFNQARTDLNFICSKLSYKDEELPIVCETVQRIERALVLLKQLNNSNHSLFLAQNKNISR